jgi:hypothetical protein
MCYSLLQLGRRCRQRWSDLIQGVHQCLADPRFRSRLQPSDGSKGARLEEIARPSATTVQISEGIRRFLCQGNDAIKKASMMDRKAIEA